MPAEPERNGSPGTSHWLVKWHAFRAAVRFGIGSPGVSLTQPLATTFQPSGLVGLRREKAAFECHVVTCKETDRLVGIARRL